MYCTSAGLFKVKEKIFAPLKRFTIILLKEIWTVTVE